MRRILVLSFIVVLAAVVLAALSNISAAEEKTQREFVGVGKCKMCHKSEQAGEQFKIWSESAHAKAYETLASETALKIAKANGIENPQEDDTCLRCHVTAHGVDAKFLGTKYAKEDGVGCESCHGPGGDYYKKSTMEALVAGTQDPAEVGLIMPDEKVCITCHNDKSPTYTAFKFDEMVKKIAHPIPAE